MPPLQLHSEPYAPTGNLASQGARNQLGRPRLDPLTVLVREAVQNSWDARDPDLAGPEFHMELRSLTDAQRLVMRQQVFAEVPPEGVDLCGLEQLEPIQVLLLSDRNTLGLGGPTRADVVEAEGEPRDFVDFLRNLGEPPNTDQGGGTFGYGKAALYAVSRAKVILVYSRVLYKDRLESRFLGAGLGQPFVQARAGRQLRYTGRHWWGRLKDGVAEPALGAEADKLAVALGMPAFKAEERGTTILIVDFDSRDRSPDQTMDLLARAILWNFWPKMVPGPYGIPPMKFSASLQGKAYPLPSPLTHPFLKPFVSPLQSVRARILGRPVPADVHLHEIRCGNPSKHLGWLALNRSPVPPRKALQPEDAEAGGLSSGTLSHLAWMRSAELVVRYDAGPSLPTSLFEYAGVFVASADPEVSRAFALSEPPTHDDWVALQLSDRRQRTLLNTALRRIPEAVRQFVEPTASATPEAKGSPLGQLSSILGGILLGLEGPGAAMAREVEKPSRTTAKVEEDPEVPESPEPLEPSPDPARPRPRKPKVRASVPRLDEDDGVGVARVEVKVQSGRNSTGTRLTLRICAMLDGDSLEDEPPTGASVPQPLYWSAPGGERIPTTGEHLDVGIDQDGLWVLTVRLVEDAAVQVQVTAEPIP